MKAAIFDMDGVLIDSEPLHFESDRRTLAEVGVALTFEDMKRFIGVPDHETYAVLVKEHNIDASVEELLVRQVVHKEKIFQEETLEPMEGLVELLEFLRERHWPLAVASSSKRAFIEKILTRLNIRSFFSAVVGGDEIKRGKPDPEIFLAAATLLGKEAKECMVVEDSTHGVAAGRKAGMYVYGLINPNSGDQNLEQAHAIVASLKEVQIHLKTNSLDEWI